MPNPSWLPAKPSEAGSPGRGGARKRTQFSPLGGNGVEWTLRRRAAMGKVGRRRSGEIPRANLQDRRAGSSRPTQKTLYNRPLIRLATLGTFPLEGGRREAARAAPTDENGPGALARQRPARLWNRAGPNFSQTQGPVARRGFRHSLRFCAPEMMYHKTGECPP